MRPSFWVSTASAMLIVESLPTDGGVDEALRISPIPAPNVLIEDASFIIQNQQVFPRVPPFSPNRSHKLWLAPV